MNKLSTFILVLCLPVVVFGQNIKLNEVLFKNTTLLPDTEGETFSIVELINSSASAVSTSTYSLSDNASNPTKFNIPNQTLNSGDKLTIVLSGNNNVSGQIEANFKWKEGENIYLSINGALVDSILSNQQLSDVSYGRFPDGSSSYCYSSPTIGTNNTCGSANFPQAPVIDLPSGIYAVGTSFSITPGSNVTENGHEVTAASPIISSGTVSDFSANPDYFSLIPTNPSLTYPVEEYTESRAHNRGWVTPETVSNKLHIVQAINTSEAFPSEITYRTYIPAGTNMDLPLLSIIVPEEDYFSDETGIYVYGNELLGNYKGSGDAWQRTAHVMLFDTNGQLKWEKDAGTRIHGSGGRHAAQKNLRLYAKLPYTNETFEFHEGFSTERLLIKSGGHRPDCVGRDFLSTQFTEELTFEKSHPELVTVYINGEYWGIHDLREKLDDKHLGAKYELDDNNILIADHKFEVTQGSPADPNEFIEISLFAEDEDLSIPQNYEWITSQIDIENFTQYFCAQIFLGNADFPISNKEMWKYESNNGKSKWRWNLFDLDGGFGGNCDTILRTFNTLDYVLQETNSEWLRGNRFLRNLLENDEYKNYFMSTMLDIMNSSFKQEVLLAKLSTYVNSISSNRIDHLNRWKFPGFAETIEDRDANPVDMGRWDNILFKLEEYCSDRQRKQRDHMMSRFSVADSILVTLNVNDLAMGYVKVNSILINANLEGTSASVYPWKGLYFEDLPVQLTAVAKPGYRFVAWQNTSETNPIINFQSDIDTTWTAIFEIDPAFLQPIVNEAMSLNEYTYYDEYGQTKDWIEIFNPNATPITVENYLLSDDPSKLSKFKFKSTREAIVPANGYILVLADEHQRRGVLHANFQISGNGESVFLSNSDSTYTYELIVPSLSYESSFGTSPNGSSTFAVFDSPTPLANNDWSSIEESEKEPETFVIYPNPAQEKFYLKHFMDIEIFDMTGRKVSESLNTMSVTINHLQPGTYLVRNEKGISTYLVKY